MRNSMKDSFSEIKDVKGRRSIRDRSEEVKFLANRTKLSNNEDRSNSEPPRSYGSYLPATSSRLKPIREQKNVEDAQGSSDEDGELSKSNSQLNESDLDLEIADSASASVSQAPTPTPLAASNARRINSETNLNDTKRRLSGFMGNRSKRFCASTSELSFSSHLDTQKSLFSAKNNALSRQSFNSSLYGSNMSLSSTNSRLFMANSPFYSGKTMFGGASAYPKRDINQHKILRTPVQMRPSSSLSNSSNTSAKSDNMMPESNAAKRILDVMNQFSGPLKEARSMGNNINSIIKIPSMVQNRQRYGEEELNLDRSIALSSPSIPYGRPLPVAHSRRRPESPLLHSSISKPLLIPTMSQLLQMKRLQNNTEKVREIASRSDSFLNRNHEYKLPSASDGIQSVGTSSSLKMKSNITKNLLRNDKSSINDQLPALPVNLPNIQLPHMKSIPKFDIQVAKSGAPLSEVTTSSIVATPSVQFNFQNSLTANSKTVTKIDFVLSKPMAACDDNFDVSSLTYSSFRFILSKPLPITENDFDNYNEILAKSSTKTSSDSLFENLVSKQKSASWYCDSCMAPNDIAKTKCVSCDASKPGSQNNSQTLLMNSIPPTADDMFKNLAAQQKKTQWECDSCMTKNDSSKDKCACCEALKPGSKPSTTGSLAPASTFTFGIPAAIQRSCPSDDLFKNLAAQQKKTQWECDACMTKNDVGKEKCACCETPRTGSITSATESLVPASTFTFGMAAAPPSDDLFKNLAAQQKKTQWECDACMTKNDTDKDKCVCCETPKPGSKPLSSASSFSFGMKAPINSTNSSFTIGKPHQGSTDEGFNALVQKQSVNWECTACLTYNEPSKTMCMCCEQAKPGSGPAAPQFSFGSKTTSSVSLPAPSEVKFSFGMPAAQVDSKKEEPTVSEKKDEVDKPKPTVMFGIAHNSFNTVETTKLPEVSVTVPLSVAPSFTFKAPSSTPTSSFSLPTSTNNESKKEESKTVEKSGMFSFGSPSAAAKAPEPEKKLTFGDIKASEANKTLSEPAKADEPKKSDFGGFKFSEKPADTPVSTFGSSLNRNGGFSFGGLGSKPAELATVAEPIKTVTAIQASAPGGFSFGASSNLNSFGNLSATSTTSLAPATNSFSFGAPKADSAAPTFGSFSSSPVKSTFEMNTAQSAPVFGQTNAGNTFSFSAKKEEPNQAAASSMFSFGAKPEQPTSAPMLFGNNQLNQAPAPTPMFGASMPPSFGSAPSTNNNNESGFGSKMPSFGSVTQPQKRTFDFGSAAPEMPQTKKFDFGGSHQQQQHQQQHQQQNVSATPFQFNAQGNENKPAFNFGAMSSPSPSFNFTNPAAHNPQTPSSAPVMQFGSGAAASSMSIPGITSFSAQGSVSSAAANQRKILRASRRTMQRR